MDDGDLKILHEARLLTPGEFDAELHSRNLGTCMVVERPFPSRALDALSIYPEYLEDLDQKLTSSVEGGLQQEITERARFFSQPDMDTNVERKERENDSIQQQINSYTRGVEEWAIMLSGEAYTSENSSVFGQETHVPLEQGENDDRPRASRHKLRGLESG